MNRNALARQALEASLATRRRADVGGMWTPVCPYDVAAAVGAKVQLFPFSGEGVYCPNDRTPSILVNSERPGPRQRYTCAHELGHHVFEHGFQADAVVGRRLTNDPAEFLADAFAGYLLMPEVAVRQAFQSIGARLSDPDAFAVFTVASEFGVGYRTLLTHLTCALGVLDRTRAEGLSRHTPKKIRNQIAPGHRSPELTVVAGWGKKDAYDVVADGLVLALDDVSTSAEGLDVEGHTMEGPVVRALRPGIWPLRLGDRQVTVRVSAPGYEGRATNRHLENEEWAPVGVTS